jgi:hypothetical protein
MTQREESGRPRRTGVVVLETFGDFWCEAAVLVGVFGLLDEILRHGAVRLAWAEKTLACAILLLVTGMAFRVWATSR